jgi:hypothetical protein
MASASIQIAIPTAILTGILSGVLSGFPRAMPNAQALVNHLASSIIQLAREFGFLVRTLVSVRPDRLS